MSWHELVYKESLAPLLEIDSSERHRHIVSSLTILALSRSNS